MASNPLLMNKDILTISTGSECLCLFCHSKFITPNMMCWFSQKTSQLSPWSKFVFGEADTSGWNRNTGTLSFLPTSVNAFKFFLKKKITLLLSYYLQGLTIMETKWSYKMKKKSKKSKSGCKVCIWDERVVRELISRSSNLALSPSQGDCVVFWGKKLSSHNSYLHPGV